MSDKDVTSQIEYGINDDEFLPINKCVCGHEFGYWNFSISIYREWATECPHCGRKLYFILPAIKVYEVDEAQPLSEE